MGRVKLPKHRIWPLLLAALTLIGFQQGSNGQTRELRVATFNVSLFRNSSGALLTELDNPAAVNPRRIAEIIQRVKPRCDSAQRVRP